jgi:two-component system, OmpR family, response regulator RegX3
VTRVLFVDDEPAIRDAVGYAFRTEGFDVETRSDGDSGLAAALAEDFDVVILDLMLPGLAGTEVCRRLRAESPVPIVMLTAKTGEVDRVLGLEIGADDYIAKPFSMAELIGRVRAILRRQDLERSGTAAVQRVGDLELDAMRHQVAVAGEQKQLTPSEFRILLLLAREPGRVYSRREIMEHLWDSTYVGDQRACDIHVSNLRRKLEDDPAHPRRVVTVRGVGYKLEAV